MPVTARLIRAEPHTEIGTLLQRYAGVIIDRWGRQAVEEQPHAKRVHHAVLLDHLHDFLTTLGKSLAESEDPHTCQHCVPALTHGGQRWQAGWSLPELVRDYQILRLVVLDFLEETLDRPVGYREVLAIGLALDEAIAASVVTYVQGRDEYLRQLEEERAGEAKRAHERLQEQAEALKEADRRKNEFLAMLGHELRNPLAPIRNATQILSLNGPPDAEVQWARGVIERQVHQMTRMVDDLLDVSRITQGKFKLEKEPVDLASVVARAAEMVRPLIDARGHRLTITLPPEPVWLDADPSRLAQVVANLLHNAAKYTDAGGQIRLASERRGEETVVTVRDTGIGIPADLLPRVFEPFTQEERLLDRAQGGLGIGLALVRSLVALHGGRVQAFSAGRGCGSEFVLYLPVSGQAPTASGGERATVGRVKAASRRILVVDDNVDSAESLAVLLRVTGHEVRTAHAGRAALEAARACVPEIVLLDIGLPGMDGYEVARRLRQDLGLADVLLVAMTGYGQDEDRRRSHEAGFNAHLVKPVDLNELHALLERSQAISPGQTGVEEV